MSTVARRRMVPGTNRYRHAPRVEMAMRVVLKYGDTIPTAKQLQEDFGFTKTNSYHWLAGIRRAREAIRRDAESDAVGAMGRRA